MPRLNGLDLQWLLRDGIRFGQKLIRILSFFPPNFTFFLSSNKTKIKSKKRNGTMMITSYNLTSFCWDRKSIWSKQVHFKDLLNLQLVVAHCICSGTRSHIFVLRYIGLLVIQTYLKSKVSLKFNRIAISHMYLWSSTIQCISLFQ